MLETVRKALIVLTIIVLAVAVFGLYLSLNAIIDIFIGYKYAPIYKALMNLAVVILAIYVLKLLLENEHRPKNSEGSSGEE
ncbi:hypothetical protein [Archaeoglobus profundus]|uniref:DUF8060 domain-containing protein n=1 Tax=Archaeoglobus profundus (strain DSM 5631 / JCM 9629 / NBRC 100127 / Av18) TaxID=572546 RepID=D2RDD7_ARCPA|nr:hypothetical protein [Archaeoglobus profundus]ADB58131.1 hypothetical protein Arcpr_1072 [Archaeoglobus profundus DSM 5631]